jgi:O-antigen ligase
MMIATIILTKSRTGMVLTFLYFLTSYSFGLFEKGRKKTGYAILAINLLILLSIVVLSNDAVSNNFLYLFEGFSVDKSSIAIDSVLSGRLEIYRNVLNFISQHPIFGNGLCYEQLGLLRPHNVLLTILYENGLVGLILYSTLFLHVIKYIRLIPRGDVKDTLTLAIGFLVLNSMFEDCLMFSTSIDYIFILLVVSAHNEGQERINQDNVLITITEGNKK